MDQLNKRVEQELGAAEADGRVINESELARKLSLEFSSVCGLADVRAAVIAAMRRRVRKRMRVLPAARGSNFSR
jgi:hypothetical protein